MIKNCEFCHKEFEASLKEHNRGNARFCSISCSSKRRKPKKGIWVKCDECGKLIYRSLSRIGKWKNTFCSNKCKNMNFVKDPTIWTYRDKALSHYGNKCQDCNYNKYVEILEVHHIDRDRNNNSIENLMVLCPNCHTIRHKIRA